MSAKRRWIANVEGHGPLAETPWSLLYGYSNGVCPIGSAGQSTSAPADIPATYKYISPCSSRPTASGFYNKLRDRGSTTSELYDKCAPVIAFHQAAHRCTRRCWHRTLVERGPSGPRSLDCRRSPCSSSPRPSEGGFSIPNCFLLRPKIALSDSEDKGRPAASVG